jgi:hypothetical protein
MSRTIRCFLHGIYRYYHEEAMQHEFMMIVEQVSLATNVSIMVPLPHTNYRCSHITKLLRTRNKSAYFLHNCCNAVLRSISNYNYIIPKKKYMKPTLWPKRSYIYNYTYLYVLKRCISSHSYLN